MYACVLFVIESREERIMGRRRGNFRGRKKTEQQPNPDRLSNLPESLIVQILSMLEMRDAVKTGILSQRWKNLWTQVYNIVLQRGVEYYDKELSIKQKSELRKIKDDQWISSVDHNLMQCTTDIKRFCLIADYCDFSDVIDKWITHVLDKKVKILELAHGRHVSDRMFQSSSITTLELCNVEFCLSSSVNLSSLKSLSLANALVDDMSVEKILMGCPMLENMVLDNVGGINHLNIMSPSVNKLTLCGFDNEGDSLNVKAPWLQELKIWRSFINEFELVDVSSLMKTTLTFYAQDSPQVDTYDTEEEEEDIKFNRYKFRWIPIVTKILKYLSYVGELIIGSEPIQVLSLSKLSGTPSPLFMCKHLSIETYLWKFDLPGIACLLENAPHLETLLIKVLSNPPDFCPLYRNEKLFQHGDPHLSMPNGKFLHLKNVKIDYWRYSCCDTTGHSYDKCFDFELVEYILRSAVALEKLVLSSSRGSCLYSNRCTLPNCRFQYVRRLSSKLIATFLSGNEAAEWELKKSNNKFEFTFSNYASLLHPTL